MYKTDPIIIVYQHIRKASDDDERAVSRYLDRVDCEEGSPPFAEHSDVFRVKN